jgi:D-serine deaminase-like pyridoxal phosphate-dependent protein
MPRHFASLDTPAILVDNRILQANIERMARHARECGLEHWPHTKTHKVPQFAQRQMDAGSPGICVAKLGEARVMAGAGIENILIANHIVGEAKVLALLELVEHARVSICVDSLDAARPLSAAFGAAGRQLDVLMEIDTGMHRCGRQPGEDAVELAKRLLDLPGLCLVGVMTYAGLIPGKLSEAELQECARGECEALTRVAEDLREVGADIRRISGGSTPRARFYEPSCGLTEIRPGTYIYNDVNCIDLGAASPEDCALTVLATVISVPSPTRATLDAGSKALTSDRAKISPGHGRVLEYPGAVIAQLDEEHAYVDLTGVEGRPAIGEKVRIIPNHVCPVSNLHDRLALIEDEQVVDVLPIAARGRSQ